MTILSFGYQSLTVIEQEILKLKQLKKPSGIFDFFLVSKSKVLFILFQKKRVWMVGKKVVGGGCKKNCSLTVNEQEIL